MLSSACLSSRLRLTLVASLTFALAGACSVVNSADDPTEPNGDGGSGNTGNTGNNGGTGGSGNNGNTGGTGNTGGSGGSGGVPATCGDGEVDPDLGETCDPPSSCPTDCDDQDSCTTDQLLGSADQCTAECANDPITTCDAVADGCCPGSCDGLNDLDCASCGNDTVELGEICDGNCPASCDDQVACTENNSTGDASTCDLVCDNPAITVCSGGDGCCPSGCSPNNDSDCGGLVFLASSNGTAGFYRYNVFGNSWSTLPNPPSVTYSQLTTDGSYVYLMGSNNTIYRFTPSSNSWSTVQAGPGSMTASAIGFFKWTSNGFYYANDGQNTMYRSSGGNWPTVTLPQQASCAGTYDPTSGRLYIRQYQNQGLMIWNTNNNTLVQQFANATSCGENSRSGSYYNGFFYTRDWSTAFNRMNVSNGQVVATSITPAEQHTATDVNPATGDMFIGPYSPSGTAFQIYNIPAGTLVNRAPVPAAVTNHSSVVYVGSPQ